MARLKDDSHPALSEASLQLVTSIEYGLAKQRWRGGIAVLRTVVDFVWETAPTGWTFFHLLARSEKRANRILSGSKESEQAHKLLRRGSFLFLPAQTRSVKSYYNVIQNIASQNTHL
jgi:hypothetical protein